jgi:hypothetical protein
LRFGGHWWSFRDLEWVCYLAQGSGWLGVLWRKMLKAVGRIVVIE